MSRPNPMITNNSDNITNRATKYNAQTQKYND